MAEHIELGKKGEELAEKYLRAEGYKILNKNWRFGKDEIDIIAEKQPFLVIVEVKTRSSSYFGEPEVFVTKKKQKFLIRATNVYIQNNNIDLETRFDIIGIVVSGKKYSVKHIPDAFYPTL